MFSQTYDSFHLEQLYKLEWKETLEDLMLLLQSVTYLTNESLDQGCTSARNDVSMTLQPCRSISVSW